MPVFSQGLLTDPFNIQQFFQAGECSLLSSVIKNGPVLLPPDPGERAELFQTGGVDIYY